MEKDPGNEQNTLLTLNSLTRKDTGVFVRPESEGLAYSDGDAEELYIQEVIASASDVSSLSEELRSFERDWSSECHLSSKRANVFRALDFSGVRRVLEIGSGCGAITRFLGELGVTVDAVEGSLRRAEITRQRCRDLENVQVVHADFNTLQLPEKLYDLVLFTGVLEYAGKFGRDEETPEEAVTAMLSRSMKCLTPGGALVVAIENRIGFKYLAGASEDHFSRPWVGLSRYPDCDDLGYRDKQGIRTWDKSQWQQMIGTLEGVTCQWYYPFPDYKLATSLLSEDFLQSTPTAWSCLSRTHSRDYTSVWHSSLDEQLFWQTAAAAGTVEEMANSFVLVMQRTNGEATPDLVPFDFAHFSGHDRKMEYRVKVQKNKKENRVITTPLMPQAETNRTAAVVQHLEEEPYYEGTLLAVHWCNVLRSCTAPLTFDALLQEYYQYVARQCEPNRAGEFLDLLPFNIIIGEEGDWHSFDQEWQTELEIVPQFIFFRALLYFYWENKNVLERFCKQQHLSNGWQFVGYCLERVLYSSEFDLRRFAHLENTIQKAVTRSDAFAEVEAILDSVPMQAEEHWSWEKTSLIWGADGEVSTPVSSSRAQSGQCILFHLPAEACSSDYLQLSLGLPEQQIGSVFTLHTFNLYGRRPDGAREIVFSSTAGVALPPLMKLTGLTFFSDSGGGVFSVDDREPQVLHFLFPKKKSTSAFKELECEIGIEFLGKNSAQLRLEQSISEKQNLDVVLEDKRLQVADLYKSLAELQHSLAEIEQSRGWQLVVRMRRVKDRITALWRGKNGNENSAPGTPDDHGSAESASVAADTPPVAADLVTVVLGVLNTGADELMHTVDSVLAQSYPNWELIIVDSGSTDGVTLKALDQLKHHRIKIHFLRGTHNLTQAMNEGIVLAGGSWITFLGQFDRYTPDALYSVVQQMQQGQADIITCDEELVGRYGDVLEPRIRQGITGESLENGDDIGSALFIRRSLISRVGGLDPEYDGVQLFDLVVRASGFTDQMVHLQKVLYRTRQFEPPSQDELGRISDLRNSAAARLQGNHVV